MMRLALAAFALVLLAVSPVRAAEPGSGLIVKESPHSAAETLDRLTRVLEAKGITVFARIDHAAGAAKVGADLAATQLLIFGNPKLGTPLMQSNRMIGLDLPLKALAWEEDGQTYLAYPSAGALALRHGISDRGKVFATMAAALDGLTNAALKP